MGEEDLYGQPQEAAMWDLLRIFYLGPFTDGTFVEVFTYFFFVSRTTPLLYFLLGHRRLYSWKQEQHVHKTLHLF